MSMITKCPACATAFRVSPQQLQAQHGMVRCGRCATVFDGFKDLATQRDVSPVETAPQVVTGHVESAASEAPLIGDVHAPPALQRAPSRSEPAPRNDPPPQPEPVRESPRSEPSRPEPEAPKSGKDPS